MLQVRPAPCESLRSEATTSEEEHFAVTPLLRVVSSFLPEKGYSVTIDMIAGGCVFRHLHTATIHVCQSKANEHAEYFSPVHTSAVSFHFFFSNCTVQTITCKNPSLQSEDNKSWTLNNHIYVICNLNSHIGNIKNSTGSILQLSADMNLL